MEMNGKQIMKKAKKVPIRIILGYIICIFAIVGSIVVMNYREKTQKPEPIDFTTKGAVGMEKDKYAFLKVEGLTDEVAIYGDTENEDSATNDRYYIAFSEGYMYIIDLDYSTLDSLKNLQEYTYSADENTTIPEPVTIYGVTEEIPLELKQLILNYYNASVGEEYAITLDDFEMYFGSALLNVRKDAVDTSFEFIIIGIFGFVLITVICSSITNRISVKKLEKYLKKNEYEQEIENQLDDFVEEKHYKDKVILTQNYFIDIKNGFTAFKYTDVKWIYIHKLRYNGIATSASIEVYLNDGKTSFSCVKINGKETEEFLDIFNKICSKVPEDALKGFSKENKEAFREYQKKIKRNEI